MTKKILLAGATGYLGRYIAHQLIPSNYEAKLIVRNQEAAKFDSRKFEVVEAQVTQPATLQGLFDDVDVVISSVGITRQKDGFSYMDVDYQANVNLLEAAQKSGVKKFIYVSALNGDKIRHLKMGAAKERFVDFLKSSGIDYCIIRPNGFFSDMRDFLDMAKGGRVYLFGDGNLRLNPIHGADLAEVCVGAIESNEKEIEVGGPDIFTHNELATLALATLSKQPKISHFPDWMRRFTIKLVQVFTSPKTYGPIEFFLTVMGMDMVAPQYGKHHLRDFFRAEVE